MSELVVESVEVRRGAFRLSADFRAPLDGLSVVFGPSGAGKSMLLATLAGLNRTSSGRIALGERLLDDGGIRTPPHARGIGLVFQDARLFPHLSVRGNLAYAAKRAPPDRTEIELGGIAERLEIADLLDRRVRNLSGGEKSRVALARAMLSAPELLLLDEPFAALDGRRRRSFVKMLREVSQAYGLPMMVVTHHVDEAAELADHVVAVKAGEVVASGAAAEVMNSAVFHGLLDRRDAGARIDASVIAGRTGAAGAWVRADNVLLAAEAPRGLSARNVWEGRVATVQHEPEDGVLIGVDTKVGRILARVTEDAVAEFGFAEGRAAWAVVKTHAL